jgi:hypothetical protein
MYFRLVSNHKRRQKARNTSDLAQMTLEDVLTGSVTHGVNSSTFIAINALLGLAVLSLASLLAVSLQGAPALVPHAAFLLLLALGLWVSIVWFVVAVVGLVDPAQQQKELFGGGSSGSEQSGSAAPGDGQPAQEPQAAAAAGGTTADKKER